ncbi:MAG: glycoside hydrolase domain-containing protein [Planctomycetota bacterium]
MERLEAKNFITIMVTMLVVVIASVAKAEPPWAPDENTAALYHIDANDPNNSDASGNGGQLTFGPSASLSDDSMFGSAVRMVQRSSTSENRTTVNSDPCDLIPTTSFSIDLWCKFYSGVWWIVRDMYVLTGSSGSSLYFLRYNRSVDEIQFGINPSGAGWATAETSTATFEPQPNRWYYIVCNYDGDNNEISLYIDGWLRGTSSVSGSMDLGTSYIGTVSWANTLSGELDGWVDELRFSTEPRPGYYEDIMMDILKYPIAGSATGIITVYDINGANTPADVNIILYDGNDTAVYAETEDIPNSLPAEFWVSLGSLQSDVNYMVVAGVLGDGGGYFTVETSEEFSLSAKPDWYDPNIGDLGGMVPYPWTDVNVNGTAIGCWNRTYDFNDSFLPVAIISDGNQILKSRMSLVIGSSSGTEVLDDAPNEINISLSETNDVADFDTWFDANLCDVNLIGSVEFDGLMTFELTITPVSSVNNVRIDIPLANDVAMYIMPYADSSYGDKAGTVGPNGISIDEPVSTIWLCNNNIGLFFVIDSTQYWQPGDSNAVDLVRSDGNDILRLNFYNENEGFSSARTYRFHLQAAPVRPFNDEWYSNDCRLMDGINWGDNVTLLDSDDTVSSMSIADAANEPNGMFEIILQNKNDLNDIIAMDYPHVACDEYILDITGDSNATRMFFKCASKAIKLETQWGDVSQQNNCLWEPNEIHKLAFTWGDKLRFYIDGALQGEQDYTGFPVNSPTLDLGSISARYVMTSLRISKAVDTNSLSDTNEMSVNADTLYIDNNDLDLRSDANTLLHQARDHGVKTMLFFEHWCDAQNGGQSKYEPLLRNMVEDCHSLGLGAIFYFGTGISELSEFADIIDECKCVVDQSKRFYTPKGVYTYRISYGSPYQEYLLYHMKRLRDDLGIDGVYLDGSLILWESDNPAFDCGYFDANSNRQATVPVDRIRRFAKRINNLFLQDSNGIIEGHMGVVPPTMGYVTNTYYGEHVGFLTAWNCVMDRIPLDIARCVYNNNNTGVPMRLCMHNAWPGFRSIVPNWYKLGSAWCDIHDIFLPVMLENPVSSEMNDIMLKQTRLADFGADTADWIPYWETESTVTSSPASTFKVSGYENDSGDFVCAIMNNTDSNVVDGWVDLTGSPLEPSYSAKCEQLISGEAVSMTGKKITVTIPAYEHLLVLIDKNYKASAPSPSDGATDVNINADLSWTAGYGADYHDVYFGTSLVDVNTATDPNTLPGRGRQAGTTYDTNTMDGNSTYYWRIDEVDDGNVFTGDIWSFTTENLPVILIDAESFETGCPPTNWTRSTPATPWDADATTAVLFSFDEADINDVNDKSGNDANFIVGDTASSRSAGKFSKALDMVPRTDANQDRTCFHVPDDVNCSDSFCIDFWCQFDDVNKSNYVVSNTNYFLRNNHSTQKIELGMQFPVIGWVQIRTDPCTFTVEADRWYYIVSNYDGDEISLYIDSNLIDTNDAATGSLTHTPYMLGAVGWADELSTELDGAIDELRVSEEPRSAGASVDATTAVLFSFNEADVNDVNDKSGNDANFIVGYTASSRSAGKFSRALDMVPRTDANQDRTCFHVPDDVNCSDSFCIDFWCQFDDVNKSNYVVSSTKYFLRQNHSTQKIELGMNFTGIGWVQIRTDPCTFTVEADRWYYIASNYDGNEISLYIDSNLIDTNDAATGSLTHTPYMLGAVGWADELSTELDGAIDELRVSEEPRTGSYDELWDKKSARAYDQTYSAGFDGSGSGNLMTPDLDCSDANQITIEFYGYDEGADEGEYYLDYFDGNDWDEITRLDNYGEGSWTAYNGTITDSQYFRSNFKVRWRVVNLDTGEHVYADKVTIEKQYKY